jgi:predicted nucleic acid-binding protein
MNNGVYLDACIFIAHEHRKHNNHKIVKESLSALEELDIQVYTSDWSLVEMCRVLKNEYGYSVEKVKEIAERIRKKHKIRNMKIKFIDIDTNKPFKFSQFFQYLQDQLLISKDIHLADAIHNLIMKNNGINNILISVLRLV